MPKSYSGDLRERVIEAVEGGALRRETAERFEVSVSSAVKWLQRWHESKSAVPKPRGGSVSPLEEFAEQILDLIAQQPDLTLVETVAELRKRRIRTSRSSLWRFLDRHGITLKKGSSWNRVGKFEGLKGRKARYFRDLLHFCRVQNLAQMLDGKDIETSSAALGYVFI